MHYQEIHVLYVQDTFMVSWDKVQLIQCNILIKLIPDKGS